MKSQLVAIRNRIQSLPPDKQILVRADIYNMLYPYNPEARQLAALESAARFLETPPKCECCGQELPRGNQ